MTATAQSIQSAIPLLKNEGYQRRYGEALATTGSKIKAWEQVERELQNAFGLRRFATYESFEVTLHNLRTGKTKPDSKVSFYPAETVKK